MKLNQLFSLAAALLLLPSCAGVHDGALDQGFASAVTSNSINGVMRNCTPRNASLPIRGVPPIAYAAGFGNEDMIDVIYNNGASLNVRNPRGQSLAYLAAASGHRSTANKLVKLGSGSSADVSCGSFEYDARRASAAAAARPLASQRKSTGNKSEGRKGDSKMTDYMVRSFLWGLEPPKQWYQQDTPRPTLD